MKKRVLLIIVLMGLMGSSYEASGRELYLKKLESANQFFKIETTFPAPPALGKETIIEVHMEAPTDYDTVEVYTYGDMFSEFTRLPPWKGKVKKGDTYEGYSILKLEEEIGTFRVSFCVFGYRDDVRYGENHITVYFKISESGETVWIMRKEDLPDDYGGGPWRYVPIRVTDDSIILKYAFRHYPTVLEYGRKYGDRLAKGDINLRAEVVIRLPLRLNTESKIFLKLWADRDLEAISVSPVMHKGIKLAQPVDTMKIPLLEGKVYENSLIIRPTTTGDLPINFNLRVSYKAIYFGEEAISAQQSGSTWFSIHFRLDDSGDLKAISRWYPIDKHKGKGAWHAE